MTVGTFSPEEAVNYLRDALAGQEPAEELAGLAADLGYLPLALSQAVAFLTDAGLDCAAYRRLLADRTRVLADLLPDGGALPDDQAAPASAAWSLALERVDALGPPGVARSLLALAAVLDPHGIPGAVLTSPPVLDHLAGNSGPGSGPVSAEDAVLALRALHRLSLIEHTPDAPHQTVRVHRLTQRSVRETLERQEQDRIARTAADALSAAWPTADRTPDSSRRCAPTPPRWPGPPGRHCSGPHPTASSSRPAPAWTTAASTPPPPSTTGTWPTAAARTWARSTRTPSSPAGGTPGRGARPVTSPVH